MRYEANEDVLDSIEEGIQALEAKDLTEAKKSLDEGRELMLKQQKLVRIADREELGWQIIKHYVADDLTTGADDEKVLALARY